MGLIRSMELGGTTAAHATQSPHRARNSYPTIPQSFFLIAAIMVEVVQPVVDLLCLGLSGPVSRGGSRGSVCTGIATSEVFKGYDITIQ